MVITTDGGNAECKMQNAKLHVRHSALGILHFRSPTSQCYPPASQPESPACPTSTAAGSTSACERRTASGVHPSVGPMRLRDDPARVDDIPNDGAWESRVVTLVRPVCVIYAEPTYG